MSDFKFACPGCGQRIAVNDNYVGHQINCPACQAPIVVPANPAAPAAPVVIKTSLGAGIPTAAPPPPGAPTKLGIAATSTAHAHSSVPVPAPSQQGSAAYRAHTARKPEKSYSGLIVGVVAVALIGLSAFLNRGTLESKWKAWHGPSPAEVAATNKPPPPPPPPPELTAAEIMEKVVAVYKEMPSFVATNRATAVMDMSAISPALAAAGPKTTNETMTLKMSKQPPGFRIDMTIPTALTNITLTGWSVGAGDFVQANNKRAKVASHDDLFNRFNAGASAFVTVGMGDIVRLFTEDTSGDLAKAGLEWTRQKDERLSGQACYVLAGTVRFQNVLLWVNRKTFQIAQTRVVLDGKSPLADMDDAQIKEAWKAQNNGKEPSAPPVIQPQKNIEDHRLGHRDLQWRPNQRCLRHDGPPAPGPGGPGGGHTGRAGARPGNRAGQCPRRRRGQRRLRRGQERWRWRWQTRPLILRPSPQPLRPIVNPI